MSLNSRFDDLMRMSDQILRDFKKRTHGYYFRKNGINTFDDLEMEYVCVVNKTSDLSKKNRERVQEAYEELIKNTINEESNPIQDVTYNL